MTAHCRKLFLVLAMFSWVPIQAQQLLGTYTVNYRWNTGGCSFSDTNPYHCAGSPGPIYVTSAPGKYKAVVTRLGPNPNGLARMWDGDSSKGTVYELPQGANVSFDHTFGQIVLYYWDWAPEDNPTDVWTEVQLYRVGSLAPPTISSLSPSSATAGGTGFTLGVTGSGLVSGSTVRWNGSALTTTFVSSTQLNAAVPAAQIGSAGNATITVANPDGSVSNSVTFTVTEPTPIISSLSPPSVTAGGSGFTLTVTGGSFLSGATVRWNGSSLTTTYVSTTVLTAAVPAALILAAGNAAIMVANPGGATSAPMTFTISAPAAPTITGLNPSSVTAGGAGFTLGVTGTGFVSGSTVRWNGSALTTAFLSSTQLNAAVPAAQIATAGNLIIRVINPDGTVSNSWILTITEPPPTLLGTYQISYRTNTAGCSFSDPNPYHCVGSPGPIYLTAAPGKYKVVVTRLGPNPNGLARMWDGDSSKGTVYELPQGATVLLDHTFGLIVLYYWDWVPQDNPSDVWTEVRVYSLGPVTIQPPTISSLSPSSATAGGAGFTLGVTGAGFVSGSTVRWNGSALTTTFLGSNQLNAAVPAAQIATAGSATITVANPDATLSNSVTFTITEPPPTLLGTYQISYRTNTAGCSFSDPNPYHCVGSPGPIYLTAAPGKYKVVVTRLGPNPNGLARMWDGDSSKGTVYELPQGATVLLDHTFGQIVLYYWDWVPQDNPSDVWTEVQVFSLGTVTVQPPKITSLNPSSITAGGSGFTLGVSGSGYVSGSTVRWNGSALSTTFVSGTQLNATVPAAQIAAAGSATITVVNADATLSNSAIFTITAPPLAPVTITTSSLPAGIVGTSYSQALSASGGVSPYRNWVLNAGSLPPGLTLDANSGVIGGVPATAAASPFSFNVIVMDSLGSVSQPKSLSITIGQPSGLMIVTPSPLPAGAVGVPYSQGFAATGGATPYRNWIITDGSAPPGTSLTTLGGVLTALLSGTPTTAGTFSFTLKVTDNGNAITSKQFSVTINPAGTISIPPNGVVNSASYLGGGVAPGEVITIFGSGIGPSKLTTLQLDPSGNVSTTLGGVQVLFDGVAAPIAYVQATQVSVVVPYEIKGKTSTQVQVTYQGRSSSNLTIPVVATAPGVFTLDSSGSGAGAILNQDGTVNSPDNPAPANSFVSVYATGEGQTDPAGTSGKLNGLPAPKPVQAVTATIGGVNATVQYAGGVPGLAAGVLQVNLQVPEAISPGNALPVLLNIGGATSQNGVTLAVKSSGN